MNGTHQVLTYADDVNLIVDDSMRTKERNADVLVNAWKDIGLAVNTWKTKYMEVGRRHGMMANENIRIFSKSYETVKKINWLGSLLTNKNYFYNIIKFWLKAGNSCYCSVQILLSSRLLSRNFKIKIYKTIIL